MPPARFHKLALAQHQGRSAAHSGSRLIASTVLAASMLIACKATCPAGFVLQGGLCQRVGSLKGDAAATEPEGISNADAGMTTHSAPGNEAAGAMEQHASAPLTAERAGASGESLNAGHGAPVVPGRSTGAAADGGGTGGTAAGGGGTGGQVVSPLCVSCPDGQHCGPGGSCLCATASCADGCCSDGKCVRSDAQNSMQCGVQGEACSVCTEGNVCVKGACRPIDCGTPPQLMNGNVSTSSSTAHGSVATYGCNASYKLSGTTTRTCQVSGSWSAADPTCTAEPDCGDGQVNGTEKCDPSASGPNNETWACSPTCEPRTAYILCSASSVTCDSASECQKLSEGGSQCLPRVVAGCPQLKGAYVQKRVSDAYCVISCTSGADCPAHIKDCVANPFAGATPNEAEYYCAPL